MNEIKMNKPPSIHFNCKISQFVLLILKKYKYKKNNKIINCKFKTVKENIWTVNEWLILPTGFSKALV